MCCLMSQQSRQTRTSARWGTGPHYTASDNVFVHLDRVTGLLAAIGPRRVLAFDSRVQQLIPKLTGIATNAFR